MNTNEYISIIVRGSSGLITGTLLANLINQNFSKKKIQIHYVHKKDENSHHSGRNSKVIYRDSFKIIVDDFMDSGDTIDRIMEFLEDIEVDCLLLQCTSSKNKEYLKKYEERIDYLLNFE